MRPFGLYSWLTPPNSSGSWKESPHVLADPMLSCVGPRPASSRGVSSWFQNETGEPAHQRSLRGKKTALSNTGLGGRKSPTAGRVPALPEAAVSCSQSGPWIRREPLALVLGEGFQNSVERLFIPSDKCPFPIVGSALWISGSGEPATPDPQPSRLGLC